MGFLRLPGDHRGRLCGPPLLRPGHHLPGAGGRGLPGGRSGPAGLAHPASLYRTGPPAAGGAALRRATSTPWWPTTPWPSAAARTTPIPRESGGPAPGPGHHRLRQQGAGGLWGHPAGHRRSGGLPPPLCPLRLLGGQGPPLRPSGQPRPTCWSTAWGSGPPGRSPPGWPPAPPSRRSPT